MLMGESNSIVYVRQVTKKLVKNSAENVHESADSVIEIDPRRDKKL